jgi:hypothetical protein
VPAPALAANGDGHPRSFADEGACLGECCTYREWKVGRDVPLYSQPKLEAIVVGKLVRGSSIEPVAGKVVTTAGRFRVTHDTGEYHRGETLWVYTYHGEGSFRVWYRGAMRDEDLGFSPYGGTAGDRCQVFGAGCWGELEEPLKTTWWAKLRTPNGVEGWSSVEGNFSGTDACG